MTSGDWQVVNDEWRVTSGKWVVSSDRRLMSGKWRIVKDKWRVTSGKWRAMSDADANAELLTIKCYDFCSRFHFPGSLIVMQIIPVLKDGLKEWNSSGVVVMVSNPLAPHGVIYFFTQYSAPSEAILEPIKPILGPLSSLWGSHSSSCYCGHHPIELLPNHCLSNSLSNINKNDQT